MVFLERFELSKPQPSEGCALPIELQELVPLVEVESTNLDFRKVLFFQLNYRDIILERVPRLELGTLTLATLGSTFELYTHWCSLPILSRNPRLFTPALYQLS